MLQSTIELFSQRAAPTSPLLVFCFYHLIVAILILSSSRNIVGWSDSEATKPVIAESDGFTKPPPPPNFLKVEETTELDDNDDEMMRAEEFNKDGLRTRAEDFIEKMNRVWKAEREACLRILGSNLLSSLVLRGFGSPHHSCDTFVKFLDGIGELSNIFLIH